MSLLIRPAIGRAESLVSYICRLAQANRYSSVQQLSNYLGMDHTSFRNNLFNNKQLEKVVEITDLPASQLYSMTCNRYFGLLGTNLAKQIVNRNKMKFCPLCLDENSHYFIAWFLRSVTTCEKHQILLNDLCSVCGYYASVDALLSNKCPKCNSAYSNMIFQQYQVLPWAEYTLFNLTEDDEVSFFGNRLTFTEVHQLLNVSLLLLEGTSSPLEPNQRIRIYHNRKGGDRNNSTLHYAITCFFWMYEHFPNHFNKVLESQLELPVKTMYYRKGAFERILCNKSFQWLKSAYDNFWLTKLNNGQVRKDFSVFKNNRSLLQNRLYLRKEEAKDFFSNEKLLALANDNLLLLNKNENKYLVERKSLENQVKLKDQYVSKTRCAGMLGLNIEIVRELLNERILKEHSITGFRDPVISKSEIFGFLGKSLKSEESEDPISFRCALSRYNSVGLSSTLLIKKILEGKLQAYCTNEKKNFKNCFFNDKQLIKIVQDIKEKRIIELGMYREEVMKTLKVGERGIKRLEVSGVLKPKSVIQLRGGRKRYIYDPDQVINLASKPDRMVRVDC